MVPRTAQLRFIPCSLHLLSLFFDHGFVGSPRSALPLPLFPPPPRGAVTRDDHVLVFFVTVLRPPTFALPLIVCGAFLVALAPPLYARVLWLLARSALLPLADYSPYSNPPVLCDPVGAMFFVWLHPQAYQSCFRLERDPPFRCCHALLLSSFPRPPISLMSRIFFPTARTPRSPMPSDLHFVLLVTVACPFCLFSFNRTPRPQIGVPLRWFRLLSAHVECSFSLVFLLRDTFSGPPFSCSVRRSCFPSSRGTRSLLPSAGSLLVVPFAPVNVYVLLVAFTHSRSAPRGRP